MEYKFTAAIYKVGINPIVDVPATIVKKLNTKGFVKIKGKLKSHSFLANLVPVRTKGYILYINGPMMKGAEVEVGDKVKVAFEVDTKPRTEPMPALLKKRLTEENLMPLFNSFSASRQKEIKRYINNLKQEESKKRNTEKVITGMIEKKEDYRIY